MVHIDLNLAKVIHEKWKESVLVSRFLASDTCCMLALEADCLSLYVLD